MSRKVHIGKCSICDQDNEKLMIVSKSICRKCYKKYFQPTPKCISCGKNKTVGKRTGSGPLCDSCSKKNYSAPKHICSICGKLRIVQQRRHKGEAVCPKCYKYPKKICCICRRNKRTNIITENGSICGTCYNSPKKICSICKRFISVVNYNNGDPLCNTCYINNKRKIDEKFYFICRLRTRLIGAFKTYSVGGKVKPSKEYGIDYEAIFEHLGPCPGDRKDYHIDHIHPLSVFDFNDPVQIRAAFAPENHQWLKAEDNLKKCAKYDKDKFNNYITNYISKNK